MNLIKALKAGHVQRWHIVHHTKYQSIAEHMYNVWLISLAIYDCLYPTPHNSVERAEVAYIALTHDLPEVVLGDIPASAKELMTERVRNEVDLLDAVVESQLGMALSHAPGLPRSIVRLADLVEAVHFAHLYIPDLEVSADVQARLGRYLDQIRKEHISQDWVLVIREVIEPLLARQA